MSKQLSFEFLRRELIGNDVFYTTPYGRVLLTYADYTASGRALKFIEKYLLHMLGHYANTHTEDDVTGRTMTGLLHQAEHLIKKAFNAEDNCYVIATGTGATGAISKMQEILGVYIPPATKKRLCPDLDSPKMEKPVIFVGPYEHHSNDIMWREAYGEVVHVQLDKNGQLDLEDLETKVSNPEYEGRFKIGAFSAASNITGLKTPVYEVARILHRHNALVCFDFAASAPYVKIDMNHDDETYFDAVFLSPHKFIGGPGSSGILVFNAKHYDQELPPTFAAGGTVDFVSYSSYDFSQDVETREKPGTPGILQTIRAALAINLKDEVGIEKIEEREQYFIRKAFERFSQNPNIEVLGPHNPEDRVAIFSLLIKQGDKYLHPKLGTRILNDVFGLQTRAGCSCAGPYGHLLLGIDEETSQRYRHAISQGFSGIKPGWMRVNFHYTFTEEDFQFICDALEFIADKGYLFIPEYVFDPATGEWSHKDSNDTDVEMELNIPKILDLQMEDPFAKDKVDRPTEYQKYLGRAEELAKELEKRFDPKAFGQLSVQEVDELRFFNFVNLKKA